MLSVVLIATAVAAGKVAAESDLGSLFISQENAKRNINGVEDQSKCNDFLLKDNTVACEEAPDCKPVYKDGYLSQCLSNDNQPEKPKQTEQATETTKTPIQAAKTILAQTKNLHEPEAVNQTSPATKAVEENAPKSTDSDSSDNSNNSKSKENERDALEDGNNLATIIGTAVASALGLCGLFISYKAYKLTHKQYKESRAGANDPEFQSARFERNGDTFSPDIETGRSYRAGLDNTFGGFGPGEGYNFSLQRSASFDGGTYNGDVSLNGMYQGNLNRSSSYGDFARQTGGFTGQLDAQRSDNEYYGPSSSLW